jgi:hypothetical protein
MKSIAAYSLTLVLGLAVLPSASAQELVAPLAAASRPWESLRADQQSILQALGSQWKQLDATDQEKWLQVAARYPKLQAEEQQRLRARMTEWALLSPAERSKVRIGWQEAQRVGVMERQAKWERYQALSADQKEALKLRASQRQLRSAGSAPERAAAPVIGPARAGASTVGPGSRSAQSRLHPLAKARVDPQTLLPKPAPASAP